MTRPSTPALSSLLSLRCHSIPKVANSDGAAENLLQELELAGLEDGSSNLQRILQPRAPPSSASSHGDPPPAVKRTSERRDSEPYPLSIGIFQIVRGTAGFVDRSIRPPGTMVMNSLDVRARNLSAAVTARSSFLLNALIDGAPLKIAEVLSPRLVNDATDLKVTAKAIDLTPLGPYVGKYLGYQLEKGKYASDPYLREENRFGFFIRGQVPGTQAVHTASDIPISAYSTGHQGRPNHWYRQFYGVQTNTDVFFKLMRAALGGD